MSTTTSTPPTPTSPSTGRTVLIAAGAAVVGGAVVAGLTFGLGGFGPSPTTTGTTPVVVHTGPSHPHVTPAPPAPSATIVTLQRELGRLNYYEGPITGTMNEQTVQAIKYLQRDAHLPETGTMNAPTQAALAHFLADGNNQMGG